jgi:hypothetical protein
MPSWDQAFILWLPSLVTYWLYLILVENPDGTQPFGVLGVDETILLKRIVKKFNVRVCTGLSRLRIVSIGGLLQTVMSF